ncbi:MAG: signal recognition particle receptor FtsY [Candidatus Mesenet longicola]|uniref:Signal recognition particle receptor FtsY n=1 Tax=Candidatus Mesenet longicola TaxID=1892558 RepID=A0A8J3MMW0_9RICK|nr:MAG: signal recognition particle receptor FtsY [Candidatus Mesenet longicola]GHM59582.1 MAG: signal recognition particle receptor FtsY [Candidatus Mesenet longicola]
MKFLSSLYSSKFISKIKEIFRADRKIDCLAELEDLLIAMDIGVEAASAIVSKFLKIKLNNDIETIQKRIIDEIAEILRSVEKPLSLNAKPHVMIFCGVNGNGKTTTIGKLAYRYKKLGKEVALVACDTFRAAATEQLEAWSERVKCNIITGKHGSYPASVAYRAMEEAVKNNIDVLLIDTAGRLHNNANFMEELAKIRKIIQKQDQSAPHNTILVLDATTGQNAYNQVEKFKEIADIDGLIITKLDGSAKGGVVVGFAQKYKINLHAIGIGEGIEDLKDFNSREFAKALFHSF